jgi:hypothetical protein
MFPVYETILWALAMGGVVGMAAVVALVVRAAHARARPRATVTPIGRRLREAA